MKTFQYIDLGLIDYKECLALQQKLVRLRAEGRIGDTLLLLEHPPVITMGTSGGEDAFLVSKERVESEGVSIYQTDRGGNATYHGPGELVGYPILDLRDHDKDVHLLLRNLEQVIVECLADYGIEGEIVPGFTGVWVGGEKICSIGIAVRRWISYHGFAFNVTPNFKHWSLIHPCGLVDKKVTSLGRLLGTKVDIQEVKEKAAAKFAKVFDMEPVRLDVRSFCEFIGKEEV
jgi:lipoate-protein ligase B